MVMKRLRRINMKPEVQNNPAVKQFNQVAEFFEGPVGSRAGPVIEKVMSKAVGFDFGFLYAASKKNLGRDTNPEWNKHVTATDMADAIVAAH